MKYLDEYRDPVLAQKLMTEIHRVTTRPWTLMEVCGGQTHTIVKQGIDEMLPAGVRMIHGPGCPVCVTPLEQIDKALAIAAGQTSSSPATATCCGCPADHRPAGAQGTWRRRAGRVLPARRGPYRTGASRQAGRLLRGRLRDHCAGQRDGRGEPPDGHGQLQCPGQPRARATGDHRAARLADQPGPGIPRRRARLRGHGLDRVRADRRAVSGTHRGHRVRAPRPAGRHPMAIRQLEDGRAEVENQYARAVKRDGNALARETVARGVRGGERSWRGIGPIPDSGYGSDRRMPASTPNGCSVGEIHTREHPACIAGAILTGEKTPPTAPPTGPVHTPETARGTDGVIGGYLRRILLGRSGVGRRHDRWSGAPIGSAAATAAPSRVARGVAPCASCRRAS